MSNETTSARPAGAGRSPLLFIFLTVFIDLLGFGIVIPLMPTYSKWFGASGFTLALMQSTFSAMQFLFAPTWGRLSDRIGRRPVLIGGLIGTAASYVVFANVTPIATLLAVSPLAVLFASRLMAGFCAANLSAASAYIADVTEEKDRAKGMGVIGAAFGLGFTFGPLLGVLSSRHTEGAATLPSLPGYLAAGLSLAAAAFGYFKLPEPAVRRTGVRFFDTGELKRALAQGRTGVLIVLNFLNLFAFSCFEAMFILFGLARFPEKFGLDGAIEKASLEQVIEAGRYAGKYMFAIGILSALVQGGLIRRLVPRFGETKLIVAGPLILAVALATVGLATTWWMVLLGCCLMPFGFGLSNPSVPGLLSRAAPADRQGSYLGMSQSAGSLARATAPACAGLAFDHFSPGAPFLMATGVLVTSVLLANLYRTRYGASFTAPPPPGVAA